MSGDDRSRGAGLDRVCQVLGEIAPLRLAESWDNVGLLVGDRKANVERLMTCLTITPDVVDEAVERRVGMIVAHHPLPFKPLAKITSDSIPGEMLLRLIGSGIAVYSAHTAFDSSAAGVNQMWAEALELSSIEPLIPEDSEAGTSSLPLEGSGRLGRCSEPTTLGDLAGRAGSVAGTEARIVGEASSVVRKAASACGSGGSFLAAAKRRGCDALVTGEATFHTCLEARSMGVGLVLVGHYGSERFAMERLARTLGSKFLDVECWASESESDPLRQSDS